MKELLIKLNACADAREWAEGKSWKEIYDTCHRGDWLLWLFAKTNPNDVQLLTLAKGHCANTVRHLMRDGRSIKAVDAAIAFGEGMMTREELKNAADTGNAAYVAAAHAYTAAYVAAAHAAAHAADAAAAAADDAADVGAAAAAARAAADDARAAAYTAAYAAYAAADAKNQKETADIVRKYIPIEKWNIDIDLKA